MLSIKLTVQNVGFLVAALTATGTLIQSYAGTYLPTPVAAFFIAIEGAAIIWLESEEEKPAATTPA